MKREVKQVAIAISSGRNGRHIPLIDFDRKFDNKARETLMDYLFVNKCGYARIIKTKKGFHAYLPCLRVSFKRYLRMMKELKADKKYISFVKRNGYGSLRIMGKHKNDLEDCGTIGIGEATENGRLMEAILDEVVKCRT